MTTNQFCRFPGGHGANKRSTKQMNVKFKKEGGCLSVNFEMTPFEAQDVADMMENQIEAKAGVTAFHNTVALFNLAGALCHIHDEHGYVSTLDKDQFAQCIDKWASGDLDFNPEKTKAVSK